MFVEGHFHLFGVDVTDEHGYVFGLVGAVAEEHLEKDDS